MGAPAYLGDEVTAAGFRLAGVDARAPAPGTEAATLDEVRARSPLVLVSATVAARIPAATLRAALRAAPPITVVVPDLREETEFPDLSARLRRQLGFEG